MILMTLSKVPQSLIGMTPLPTSLTVVVRTLTRL